MSSPRIHRIAYSNDNKTIPMPPIISVKNLLKTYATGHHALKDVTLDIEAGEILALLEPNGAGKTALLSTICGIVTPSAGTITVAGYAKCRERGMSGLRTLSPARPQPGCGVAQRPPGRPWRL